MYSNNDIGGDVGVGLPIRLWKIITDNIVPALEVFQFLSNVFCV